MRDTPQPDVDSPESMPELTREITMLRGAMHSVRQRTAQLAVKLQPVLGAEAYEMLEKELTGRPNPMQGSGAPQTTTLAGRQLRQLQSELHDVEVTLELLSQQARL